MRYFPAFLGLCLLLAIPLSTYATRVCGPVDLPASCAGNLVPSPEGTCELEGKEGTFWNCVTTQIAQEREADGLQRAIRTTESGIQWIVDQAGQVYRIHENGCSATSREILNSRQEDLLFSLGVWERSDVQSGIDLKLLAQALISGHLNNQATLRYIASTMSPRYLAEQIHLGNLSPEELIIITDFMTHFDGNKMNKVMLQVGLKEEFGFYSLRTLKRRLRSGALTPAEVAEKMALGGNITPWGAQKILSYLHRGNARDRETASDIEWGIEGIHHMKRLAGGDPRDVTTASRQLASQWYLMASHAEIEKRKVCGGEDHHGIDRGFNRQSCQRLTDLQNQYCQGLNQICPGQGSTCSAMRFEADYNFQCPSVSNVTPAANFTAQIRNIDQLSGNLATLSSEAYVHHYRRISRLETGVKVASFVRDFLKSGATELAGAVGGQAGKVAMASLLTAVEDVAEQTILEDGPYDPRRTFNRVAITAVAEVATGRFDQYISGAGGDRLTSAVRARFQDPILGTIAGVATPTIAREAMGATIEFGKCSIDRSTYQTSESARQNFQACLSSTVGNRIGLGRLAGEGGRISAGQ